MMTAKGYKAMLVLSLVLIVLGSVSAFVFDNTAGQIVAGAMVAFGAFAAVRSTRLRRRHVQEVQRRRDAGELI